MTLKGVALRTSGQARFVFAHRQALTSVSNRPCDERRIVQGMTEEE
jgi:hypothetical protein